MAGGAFVGITRFAAGAEQNPRGFSRARMEVVAGGVLMAKKIRDRWRIGSRRLTPGLRRASFRQAGRGLASDGNTG